MRERYALEKLAWYDWNPGLDNDHLTLGDVLKTLPAIEASAVPWIIRLVENPSSPVALPGAITLARHDAIHVLIGRGLSAQDEAFVIGFTMGASKKLRKWQEWLFIAIARFLYPRPYDFKKDHIIAFRLGVAEGRHQKATALEDHPFEDEMDVPLGVLRKRVAINTVRIRSVYRWEKKLLPNTRTSRRVDLDVGGLDASATRVPEGPSSDWKRRG